MNKKTRVAFAIVGISAMVAACGGGDGDNSGGGGGPTTAAAKEAGAELKDLLDENAQDRDALKDGGQVTLSVGSLGPDFNTWSNAGNTADNDFVLSPIRNAGCWTWDYEGTPSLDEDYCTSFESEEKGGKQVITIKVNEKATFNDGTPIDAEAFINHWKVMNGENTEFDIVSPGSYEYIEKVEEGDTPKDVIVTMKTPTYPIDALYGSIMHPKMNDPKFFNEGFAGKLNEDLGSGPWKLDKYDSAAKTVSYVPNDKWWGEEPVLDKLIFRQMEANSEIPAFKNKEIDAVGARTLQRYTQVDGTPDSEVRRGQRLFSGGLNINAKRGPLKETEVRKAIFQAVDRGAVRDVRFNGLNWQEEDPGSMMLMPFSPYYQDNYPVEDADTEGAKKTLEDAGWKLNGDVYEKDGKKLTFKITNFGDDPTSLATVQTIQDQLKQAGMEVGLDQRGDSDFGAVVGGREFDVTISGYTVGSDATNVVKQFYDSRINENGLGDKDLDKRISEVPAIEDDEERNKEAMNIEKEHMEKYFSMGTVMNGPSITFVRTGLANYGPSLFKSYDWINLGWQK